MHQQTILQPGSNVPDAATYLPTSAGTAYWGRLPCGADRAVLSVDPGQEVVIDTLSHEGILEDQGGDPLAYFAQHGVAGDAVLADAVELATARRSLLGDRRPGLPGVVGAHGGHVVTGPIEVRGARPGDLLAIRVLSTEPRVPYGVISNRHGRGALPDEYPARRAAAVSVFAEVDSWADGAGRGSLPLFEGSDRTVRFDLHPFLGIMGVAAAGDERPHSVPPGPFGGNIDINLLGAGSTLYLPVQVAGALAYVGDPHFAQGDGEVALTAFEASLRAGLRFDVIPASDAVATFGRLVGPLAETAEFLVPTGLDRDLDVAVQNCVRAAIALLEVRYGMSPAHAYAYLSAATDFDISQVVDVVKGVHARIRKADFAAPG
ncbi:acetamidase/formamidase family protein [Promicromonospora iranensis]|uniref:Acetamidase/formamidase n=1 Tax=Promicromonospora iranensis TaxID=1105144 RepID=A0ABU2CTH9_9MICO|nr:acetamidase/formamidase family protein [Promicromonospora iranensis]MDR7384630.1 acetamidase/formamidase [Promicromonospora iranensis]